MTTIPGNGDANGTTDLQVRLKYSKSEKDDWTKVEDKALRKRIQDRLAKRKSRTHGPKDKTKKRHGPKHSKETCEIAAISEEAATRSESESLWRDTTDTPSQVLKERWVASSSNSPPFQDDVDKTIQGIFATPGLAEHRYISLMEYSVLRAFFQNANLLAIDPVLLADDYALSPWTTSNPYPGFAPDDLSPTPLQLSTPHHPYLDMITPPSLRDNVLLSVMTDEQEDRLCYEMHRGSFTIWGSQPWNALGM
ncbi:hypothetical protein HO133_006519 [Letharia lupina]|uniref:Uncharacterized protein n=1 Tax=Letharia lupina TaxID=560253 RepID=A0A8H6C687_9LECA|nr:uncharacterized protein HO133_006519 [Letharia lupina]KAF6217692.1 hypothetical protein HO133_006519 [Letharia lupina]